MATTRVSLWRDYSQETTSISVPPSVGNGLPSDGLITRHVVVDGFAGDGLADEVERHVGELAEAHAALAHVQFAAGLGVLGAEPLLAAWDAVDAVQVNGDVVNTMSRFALAGPTLRPQQPISAVYFSRLDAWLRAPGIHEPAVSESAHMTARQTERPMCSPFSCINAMSPEERAVNVREIGAWERQPAHADFQRVCRAHQNLPRLLDLIAKRHSASS